MLEKNGIKRISEQDFKRLCGEVWAQSLNRLDATETPAANICDECHLLKDVFSHLKRKLDIEEAKANDALNNGQKDARAYREAIDDIIRQRTVQAFDHERILDRLLREVLQAEAV